MVRKPDVAVLGLGAMGHAFASNLLKKEFVVTAWNRTKARGEDLVANGLKLSDSPVEAVKNADVVIVMLTDAETTEAIVAQIREHLKSGAILCQMGTIGVESTDKLAQALGDYRQDITFIDAPVSGTKAPAENAQILILASGDRERAANAEPVFAAIGKGTLWLGEAGRGSRMKLVVNTWLILLMQGLSESLLLADQFGFSEDDLWAVLDGGPLAVPYAKAKMEMIKSGSYAPQMQLNWALKDARLALSSVSAGQTLPCLRETASLWRQAVDAGYGADDLSVVYHFQHQQKQ
ncbi:MULTISPECIES: NAD(P)-dependent oxidoreductase [unclassified Brenneria]|uniref:NAD(P)-dependent oxidoreductase n=1 Tax=unclassified Brenneria TaxID=2634434 RepID=UPI001556486E|nr:NAD(P)-dependent oxidoreductase [Brenneria sp. hezel4-2-4]MEE3649915.1 NAD(P)-dependent oxidoreductase [Brenneria sp. HEZEL_4_2_4]NPC99873.1 NAD(P)-dependent oxidoreductase [Brenneria sp. hezel4-2-4]